MLFKLFLLFKLNAHCILFHLIIFLFCFVFFALFFCIFLMLLNYTKLINFNKKEKSLFENQAHSDTNNKQQQFPDKIYLQKATSQYGEKGNKHSKKPTTDEL